VTGWTAATEKREGFRLMSCNFLFADSRSRIGFYCRSVAPCPYLKNIMDCPCIESAREFEKSILRPEYLEAVKIRVRDACKDVSVIT